MALSLIAEAEVFVQSACDCCGDFNVWVPGLTGLWRWESYDPKFAEQHVRGGGVLKLPRGTLLKSLDD